MNLFNDDKRRRRHSLSLIVLIILLSNTAIAQSLSKNYTELKIDNSDRQRNFFRKDILPGTLSIQIKAGILPKPDIETFEGEYHLKSGLPFVVSGGINYQLNRDSVWIINSGLHVNLIQSHYFLHIQDDQLNGFLSTGGAPQIEDKQVYFTVTIPLKIQYKFWNSNRGFWGIGGGINLNYSGFSSDEIITMGLADNSRQLHDIFYGKFSSDNNKKPWVSFLLTTSKYFQLKNNKLLSIEFFLEKSNTQFLKGNYQITIPNRPITKGSYSIIESCIGLAIQYTFSTVKKIATYEYDKSRDW